MQSRIELVESRLLRFAYCAQTVMAGISLVLLEIPPVLSLIGILLLLINLWLSNRRRIPSPQALSFADGFLSLEIGGECLRVHLASECHCHPSLIVLHFRLALSDQSSSAATQTMPRSLVLLQDSAPPDALRRLRVFLRWQAFDAGSGAALSEPGSVARR